MLHLRATEPADANLLFRWENDPENWQVSGTQIPFSLESIKIFIENQQSDIYISRQVRFMIEWKGETVGCVDLFDFDPLNLRAGVGILIEKKFREQNIAFSALLELGKIAVGSLNLHQLYAHIGLANTASLNLFKKAGYINCGQLKDWQRNGIEWEDVMVLQKILV